MRAVIYCRVSTAEQVENLSIETQEQACRAYCTKHGYEVAHVFVDPGESAKTTNRPEFLRMLAACRAERGRIHAVVVYALTRFSRSQNDHHTIRALLAGLSIHLRSATEPIDESATGKLFEGMLAAFAEYDNNQRSERTKAGMRAALQRGRWVWVAPLGYRTGHVRAGEPSLVPDEQRAPLVRLAFETVAAGDLCGHPLARMLYAKGLRTKQGKKVHLSVIDRMLRNPIYIGLLEPALAGGVARVGDFDPLITEELFYRVQRARDAKAAAVTRAIRYVNHPDFPLRRFVTCAQCRKALSGGWSKGRSKRYGFYHCKDGCTNVSRAALQDAFLEQLDALKPDPDWMRFFASRVLAQWQRARRAAYADGERLHRLLEASRRRLATLDQAFIFEQRIDETTYRQQRDRLREEIALLTIQHGEATRSGEDVEAMLAFATDALTHASRLWEQQTDVAERIRIQWTFFPDGLRWAPVHTGSAGRRGAFLEPRNVWDVYQLRELPAAIEEWGPTRVDSLNRAVDFLRHISRLQRAA